MFLTEKKLLKSSINRAKCRHIYIKVLNVLVLKSLGLQMHQVVTQKAALRSEISGLTRYFILTVVVSLLTC